MNKPLKIAIAGLGTVGTGAAKAIVARNAALAARAGRALSLSLLCDRDVSRFAPFAGVATTGSLDEIIASDADVVVELIGGENGPALALAEGALKAGKHVVTANKAMLAHHGAALAALAEANGVGLRFEAAVAGGIPILKSLRESLFVYGVSAVRGVLNGTCNYILTQMESSGRPFADVLADAQRLGYAEANPTLDVGGGDTAHKLTLLASMVFGVKPDLDAVAVEGIEHITPEDIAFAREFGYRIKLLGIAKKTDEGIDMRVQPAMVAAGTPIGDVDGVLNAVVADANEAGPFFFEGRGAGECPTANAVVADIVDIARGNTSYPFGIPTADLTELKRAPGGSTKSAYYIRFDVIDAPGVLAEIAGGLAKSGVSIESMLQRGRAPGEAVSIVMITHPTTQGAVSAAIKTIAAQPHIIAPPCLMPMEAK